MKAIAKLLMLFALLTTPVFGQGVPSQWGYSWQSNNSIATYPGSVNIPALGTTACIGTSNGILTDGTCDDALPPIYFGANFNVECSGGDDTTALQSVITDAENLSDTNKMPIVMFSGTCNLTAPLTITKPLIFSGVGNQSTLVPANSIDTIDITYSSGIICGTLRDFTIQYGKGDSNTNAIKLTGTDTVEVDNCLVDHLVILGAYNGIYIDHSIVPTVRATLFSEIGNDGIVLNNSVNGDHGDFKILGNTFTNITNAAVEMDSGGGLDMTNNKASVGRYGFYLPYNQSGNTGTINVSANSIEGFEFGAYIIRTANSGQLFNVQFVNNEFESDYGIVTPHDATGQWLHNVILSNNTWLGSATVAGDSFYTVDSIDGLSIIGGMASSQESTSVKLSLGSSITNAFVGTIAQTGTFANDNYGSAGILLDNQIGLPFANLPAVANGSRVFVTDGTAGSSPCTGGSTGAQAIRENSAWVCK